MRKPTFYIIKCRVIIIWGRGKKYASYMIGEKKSKFFRKVFEFFEKFSFVSFFRCFCPNIGCAETIRLVRKSSKSELSTRFFGRLKFLKQFSLPWTVNHMSKIIRELNPQPHINGHDYCMGHNGGTGRKSCQLQQAFGDSETSQSIGL